MKRVAIFLGILLCALAGFGGAVVATQALASPAPPAPQSHHLIGYAGKIIAVKPPGDWIGSGGPAGTWPAPNPARPLVLPVFGTDVNIMASNETFIAANPQNPLQFISGSNAVSRAYTSNGGQSWILTSPAGIGDPAGTYDNANNAYFAQLSTGTCPDPAVVSRSADGGNTWGPQLVALSDASPSDHFIDKEWIAADTWPASPFYGRVYVTASSFYAPGCNLGAYINNREVIAFSTNQGSTWSAPVTLSDASHDQDQFTNPVVAPTGTLLVGYQYQNCTYNCTSSIPMVQLLTRSTDGGLSFSPSITITGQPISPTGAFSGGYQYLYASSTSTGFRHNDQAIIGVAPSNPNQIYAVWTDGRFESTFVYQTVTGWHADIVFSRSTDGGTTWSPVVKINDDNVQGKDQFFPWMTVGSDGTIHVSWMDRREAPVNGFPYREYYSQSTDGGLTWSANQPVGDVAGTPGSFIGDYAGIAVNANNTLVLPIWTDQRSGQRVYTDRGIIPVQGTPTSTPTVAATATSTPTVPPTATATAVPPSATRTPIPPTATPAPASPTIAPPSATRTTVPTAQATNTPAATETPCSIAFSDVHPTDYFYEPVRYLYCHGVISGYADNTFRPYNNTTRGQMVKIVVLGFGYAIQTPATPTFSDVPPSHPFYQFVETAAANNIVSGYADGTFRPQNNVTRGQLSKIDVVAAGWTLLNPPAANRTFADVIPNTAFYETIETAACHQIISGYTCGGPGEPCGTPPRPYFRQNNDATRGQIAKIVYLSITDTGGSCSATPLR